MYEAVHAAPDGESTVARLALTAREYGYDGIVLRNHGDSPADADLKAIAGEFGLDVVSGLEIRTDDPDSASGYIGNYRSDYTVLAVHGTSVAMNRFAVGQPKVDVLAHPMAGDGDCNHVLARQAAENGVRLELNLRGVLGEEGGTRVRAIQDLRKLWDLIDDAGAPYVVTADPQSHLQLRARRELTALGDVIGLDETAIETGLKEWQRLAERNRERQAEAFVEPGVWRGRADSSPGTDPDDGGSET